MNEKLAAQKDNLRLAVSEIERAFLALKLNTPLSMKIGEEGELNWDPREDKQCLSLLWRGAEFPLYELNDTLFDLVCDNLLELSRKISEAQQGEVDKVANRVRRLVTIKDQLYASSHEP